VLTGSANLSLAAFEGRQHEVNVAFDGEHAWQLFDGYYQRDWKDSVPIEPDALITSRPDGTPAPRDVPLALDEVPIVRVLNAGIALVDQPPRPMPAGFAADALRQARQSARSSRIWPCRRTRPVAPWSTRRLCYASCAAIRHDPLVT
jgi:hypothetical protein